MSEPGNNNLMRNLGRFFGHLGQAIKSDTTPEAGRTPAKREVRREVEEERAVGPSGERVTLRRTTIEEVEIEPGDATDEGQERS